MVLLSTYFKGAAASEIQQIKYDIYNLKKEKLGTRIESINHILKQINKVFIVYKGIISGKDVVTLDRLKFELHVMIEIEKIYNKFMNLKISDVNENKLFTGTKSAFRPKGDYIQDNVEKLLNDHKDLPGYDLIQSIEDTLKNIDSLFRNKSYHDKTYLYELRNNLETIEQIVEIYNNYEKLKEYDPKSQLAIIKIIKQRIISLYGEYGSFITRLNSDLKTKSTLKNIENKVKKTSNSIWAIWESRKTQEKPKEEIPFFDFSLFTSKNTRRKAGLKKTKKRKIHVGKRGGLYVIKYKKNLLTGQNTAYKSYLKK